MDIEQKAYMIDQAVSMDLPGRHVARQLYDAASKSINAKALCLAAAEKISKAARKGDFVFILTGFPIPPMNIPETDGPAGAEVLAETLQAMKLKPIFMTDDVCSKVVAAGALKKRIIKFPTNADQASQLSEKVLYEYNPAAIVAIERPGWNREHEYHNMRGLNISNAVGKTDYVFEFGRKNGALTIGVGDGGNELGCGLIYEAVRKYVPNGAKCQCPCKGGIAGATRADALVIGGVSNWGAYGISANLGLLNGVAYQHDKIKEFDLLNRVVKAGAIDSFSLEHKSFVDGLSPEVNGLVVDLICAIKNA